MLFEFRFLGRTSLGRRSPRTSLAGYARCERRPWRPLITSVVLTCSGLLAATLGCDQQSDRGSASNSGAPTPTAAPIAVTVAPADAYRQRIAPLVEELQRMRVLSDGPSQVAPAEFRRQMREVRLRRDQAAASLAAADRARPTWARVGKAIDALDAIERGLQRIDNLTAEALERKAALPRDGVTMEDAPALMQGMQASLAAVQEVARLDTEIADNHVVAGEQISRLEIELGDEK